MVRRSMRPRGFTLIELMIVVAIISVLASLAVLHFIRAASRVRASEAKTNLRAIAQGETLWYNEKNRYTDDGIELGSTVERGNRFTYVFKSSPSVWQTRSSATLSTPSQIDGLETDTFKFPALAAHQFPTVDGSVLYTPNTGEPDLNAVGRSGIDSTGKAFAISAYGNVDADSAVDSWFIASESAYIIADPSCPVADVDVPADEPGNTYDDSQCGG